MNTLKLGRIGKYAGLIIKNKNKLNVVKYRIF